MTSLSLRRGDANVRAMLAETWRARALAPFIFSRSILIIYQKTILGWFWLIIRPAIAFAVMAYVSRQLLGVRTGAIPFLAFIAISFAFWLLFHRIIRHGTRALTRTRAISRRLPAPRLLFVIGALAPTAVEASVALAGASAVLLYFTLQGALIPALDPRVLAAPLALCLLVMLGFGLACVLSILNAFAADTALTINYALSIVLFATPVIYPLSAAPDNLRTLLELNPLTGVFELWRWAMLGAPAPEAGLIAHAMVMACIILLAGLVFFARFERAAVDRL
jgi:lipopolysaccharide transport system permease protein